MLTLAEMVYAGLFPSESVASLMDSQYHFNNDPKSERVCESGVSMLVFKDDSLILMDNENRTIGYAGDLVGAAHLLVNLRERTPSAGLTRAIDSVIEGVNNRLRNDPDMEGGKEILDILGPQGPLGDDDESAG